MKVSRKKAMRTLLRSSFQTDRCNRKRAERISSCAKRPDRLKSEAFRLLLRNAQPRHRDFCLLHRFSIPYFIATNSSCSSSFQLPLLKNLPGMVSLLLPSLSHSGFIPVTHSIGRMPVLWRCCYLRG